MHNTIKSRYSIKDKSVVEIIIVSFIILCFVLITIGTVYNAALINQTDSRNNAFVFFLTLLTGIFLFLFISLIFKLINKVGKNKQFVLSIIFFSIYVLILIWLVTVIDVHPETDSSTDIDTGWYMSNNALTMDNYHNMWLERYPNNYIMILTFKLLARIAQFFHISNFVFFLTVINACLLAGGLVLTYLCALNLWGIRTANRILLLMVLNPVYYFFIFWIYTSSFSVPLMMGIIFVLIRLEKAKTIKRRVIDCVILGVLLGVGYHIRATAVFPIAAYILLLIIRLIRGEYRRPAKIWLYFFICAIIVGISFFVVYKIGDMKIESIFGEQRKNNFPVSQWLYMGSHGNGNLSTLSEDTGFKVNITKDATYLKGTIYNYKKAGIAGTADLWFRKMLTVFSDARTGVTWHNLRGNSYTGSLQPLMEGFLLSVYAYAYRLIIYTGIVFSCFNYIRKKQKSDILLLFLFIMIVAILFYFIWEAKSLYNLVFMPTMVLASEQGLHKASEQRRSSSRKSRIIAGAMAGALILLNSLVLWAVLSQVRDYSYIRINGDTYGRTDDKIKITIGKDEVIKQEFVCDDYFNNILIRTDVIDHTKNMSEYTITLNDSTGIILSKKISEKDIIDNNISLDIDKKISGGDYTLEIENNSISDANIVFFTGRNYYLDSYEGTLEVNHEKYIDDLSMVVRENGRAPYLPVKSRMFVLLTMDAVCVSGVLGYMFFNPIFSKKETDEV